MFDHITRRAFLLLLSGALLAAPAAYAQTTWYVDDDAPNDPCPGDPNCGDPLEDGFADHPFDAIQEGIDAALDGDTVLVLDGTYTGTGNRDLDFSGKAVTVRSENGPEGCIIDCQSDANDQHRGFYFHSGEGRDAIVEGLTITDAYNSFGAGVYCEGSSPTITNCWMRENGAYSGGGVYCDASSPVLANCTINGSWAYYGGGVYCCSNSGPTLTNCMINDNEAYYYGGGVYCDSSDPVLTNCAMNANSAGVGAGFSCCGGSSPMLTNCTISGGWAYTGSGVYCDSSNATLTNCTISGNRGDGRGAGVCCESSDSMLTNCTISGNSIVGRGGGVYYDSGNPMLTNCTISGNSASAQGSGVYCYHSNPTITNCILWGDTRQEMYTYWSYPLVICCDIEGGWSGDGNIDADPLFVDPDGPDDDPNTWEDNDYRLNLDSPCIDAGDNTAVPTDVADLDGDSDRDERVPFDLDGNPRFVQYPFADDTGVPDPPHYGHIVDMGAFEYQFCLGDLDDDGLVGLSDLAALLGYYGTQTGATYYDGDLDGDGDVDLVDLAELLAVYRTVCP